jgi:hypothetical protein
MPGQVIWHLWWTKWNLGRLSPSTSAFPTNHHSTKFSVLIINRGRYNRPIGGRRAVWTQLDSTPHYSNLVLNSALLFWKLLVFQSLLGMLGTLLSPISAPRVKIVPLLDVYQLPMLIARPLTYSKQGTFFSIILSRVWAVLDRMNGFIDPPFYNLSSLQAIERYR